MAVADLIRNRLFSQGGGVTTGLASLTLRVGGLAAGFLLGVVLARTLGPAQFGIYGLVVALAALGTTAASLGTPQLAVREFGALAGTERASSLRPLARSFLSATIVAAVAIATLAVLIGWIGDRASLAIVIPGAICIPFLAVTALTASQLRGLGAMNRGQVMDIVARPAAALGFVLVWLGLGWRLDSATALWVQAGVSVFAAAISLKWLFDRLPAAGTSTGVAPWLGAAFPLCMVDLLRMLDGTYGSVLLGWLSSDVELGLYRAAISCSAVVAMPVTILHIIYAPTVARLIHAGERLELQRLLGRIALSATALVASITAGCLLLGRPLINLVFGQAYDGSWAPLMTLCIAQLAFALFGMGPILLAMGRRERRLTIVYLAAIASASFASLLLVRPLGAVGVAIGQLVSLSLVGGLSWLDGKRTLNVDCSIFALLRR